MVTSINKKRRYIFIFSFLLLLFPSFFCLYFAYNKKVSNQNTLEIAHRGYADKNEESTIKAFKYAIRNNTDGLEFDIRQTSDKIIIVSHNETIKYFDKSVQELTFNQIQKHTSIPSFKEVLKLAKKHNLPIWVELKDSYLYSKIIDNLLNILKEEDYENNIIIQSFDLKDLNYIYMKNKNIKLLKLDIFPFRYYSIPSYIEYIGLPFSIGILDCNVIERIHKQGHKIIFWRESSLFENKYFINFFLRKEADGVMIDKPLKYIKN